MAPKNAAERVLEERKSVAPLGLLVHRSAKELGNRINEYLMAWERTSESFIMESDCPRFQTGDGKGIIKQTVRGDDLFILVDVGNYNCKYKIFGQENSMSPDDHYQDLKRLIQAAGGKAHRINVIMPILYGGRQHRRNYRESLDCAVALQELQNLGVTNIVAFDAHDPRVHNAIPITGFDNVMPSYQMLKALLRNVPDISLSKKKLMVVSPDEGAMNRNIYYASILGVDLGVFYKRRDYSKVVDGRNPIVAHKYLGRNVAGKDILITDDIISSGESMLDIAYELKKRDARRIYASATYAVFTNGLAQFDKAYEEGVIHGVLGTNLTYISEEIKTREWFYKVDVAKYIAYIVASMNRDVSISLLLDPTEKIKELLERQKRQ